MSTNSRRAATAFAVVLAFACVAAGAAPRPADDAVPPSQVQAPEAAARPASGAAASTPAPAPAADAAASAPAAPAADPPASALPEAPASDAAASAQSSTSAPVEASAPAQASPSDQASPAAPVSSSAGLDVATASDVATPPAASSADTPPRRRRAVLLPVEFTVYQSGVGGALEAMPDWTEAARENLSSAALAVAKERADVELVPLPDLTPEEKQQLHEHVALARLIVTQGSQLNNKAFKARRADFDRSFGDGLRFLRERAGADFAILLDGAMVKQSGGSIFMQFALAAAGVAMAGGGGTQVVASVLDLEGGDVEWFNSTLGVEVFGMGGKDVRDTATTQKLLADLFAPYPTVPALKVE